MKTRLTQDATKSPQAPCPDELVIRVIRSNRRRKTVSARLLNWHTLEIRVPAHLSEAQIEQITQEMVARALRKRRTMRNYASDETLEQRATHYNDLYFAGQLRWRSIRFVSNQQRRFGSCSPTRGTIRISDRLRHVPDFVLDYVIIHELAHLLQPDHSPTFWELVYRYPKTERARGYLMAMELEQVREDTHHTTTTNGNINEEDETHAS